MIYTNRRGTIRTGRRRENLSGKPRRPGDYVCNRRHCFNFKLPVRSFIELKLKGGKVKKGGLALGGGGGGGGGVEGGNHTSNWTKYFFSTIFGNFVGRLG